MGQYRSQEEITTCLFALTAWAGNSRRAAKFLESEKGIKIHQSTLEGWKQSHGDEYDKIREDYSAQLEGTLANEFRDVARLAVEAQRLAVETAMTQLANGRDQDPARSAANLARVSQSSTDKLLALTGRPTQITETRDVSQILRSLAARGVLELPEGDVSEISNK